eukprot:3928283-Prymnesium_polylepis.1
MHAERHVETTASVPCRALIPAAGWPSILGMHEVDASFQLDHFGDDTDDPNISVKSGSTIARSTTTAAAIQPCLIRCISVSCFSRCALTSQACSALQRTDAAGLNFPPCATSHSPSRSPRAGDGDLIGSFSNPMPFPRSYLRDANQPGDSSRSPELVLSLNVIQQSADRWYAGLPLKSPSLVKMPENSRRPPMAGIPVNMIASGGVFHREASLEVIATHLICDAACHLSFMYACQGTPPR